MKIWGKKRTQQKYMERAVKIFLHIFHSIIILVCGFYSRCKINIFLGFIFCLPLFFIYTICECMYLLSIFLHWKHAFKHYFLFFHFLFLVFWYTPITYIYIHISCSKCSFVVEWIVVILFISSNSSISFCFIFWY